MLLPPTFGLAAVLAFIACPAGTEAQFINKMLKFCTNVEVFRLPEPMPNKDKMMNSYSSASIVAS